MDKEERYIIEKEIEYLSQLQEKEKFNYNIWKKVHIQSVMISGIMWITFLTTGIIVATTNSANIDLLIIGISLIVLSFLVLFIGLKIADKGSLPHLNKIGGDFHKRGFRIEEKYKQLGVDVDKLE